VQPLGFSLEDRYLKRAGLDYWDKVKVNVWSGLDEVFAAYEGLDFYLATTRTGRSYCNVSYNPDSLFFFGSESRGLAKHILDKYPDRQIRIPMLDIGRSLNLSNAAAVIIYEVLRQNNFPGLK